MPLLDPEILTNFATLIFEASELPPDVARMVVVNDGCQQTRSAVQLHDRMAPRS